MQPHTTPSGMPTANPANGTGTEQPNSTPIERSSASVFEAEKQFPAIYAEFKRHQKCDRDRNGFVAKIIRCFQVLAHENESLKAERERDLKNVKAAYDAYLNSLTRAMSDNPFVMILIDGDGMIFEDRYLELGEEGGRQAASDLCQAVRKGIENDQVDVPRGFRIICRVYANVRGLADVLVRKGIITYSRTFEEFVRGFTRGKTLCDFVDVGGGKDRADEKIIESFKIFSQDLHCRRLLFGCSHDNGYARSLEEYSDRPEILNKVILLEGVPFEKELQVLPYKSTKFRHLFRDSKIVLDDTHSGNPYSQPLTPTVSRPSTQQTYRMLFEPPTRFPVSIQPPPGPDNPSIARTVLSNASVRPTASPQTPASDGAAQPKIPSTWAMLAASSPRPPTPPSESLHHRRRTREQPIIRNRMGQRIDPPSKPYDKAQVTYIKKKNLCNNHHLRGRCTQFSPCPRNHGPLLPQDQLATLRLIARMKPCVNSTACEEVACIYGHHCPCAPRSMGVKGTKSCILGETCCFAPDLHDIDTNVVKTLVIR